MREWAAIVPMIVLMVWMGVAPQTFLPSIGASDARTLEHSKVNVEIQVKNPPGTGPMRSFPTVAVVKQESRNAK